MPDFLVYRPKPRRASFRILRTDRGYRVVGRPPDEDELAARAEGRRRAGGRRGRDRRRGVRVPVTGLFGSVFDPPHDGHVALLRDARARFGFERRHRARRRRSRAQAGRDRPGGPARARPRRVPGEEVELDRHARTIDMLRERRFDDPVFLVGADQFADFLSLEGAGRRPRAGAPRRRDTARLPARAPRARCWRRSTAPIASSFFEIEPLRRVVDARSASGWRAASRSTGSSRAAVAAEIERARALPARRVAPLDWARSGSWRRIRPDVTRTRPPHRRPRPGEAGGGRRHPRHAAGLHLHGLLRDLHGPELAADEGDPRRGARPAEEGRTHAPALRRGPAASPPGSSPTTSTSCCTSSRPRRAGYYRLEELWGDVPSIAVPAEAAG